MTGSYRRKVLDCASPLAPWTAWVIEGARGLAQSKTLTRQKLIFCIVEGPSKHFGDSQTGDTR